MSTPAAAPANSCRRAGLGGGSLPGIPRQPWAFMHTAARQCLKPLVHEACVMASCRCCTAARAGDEWPPAQRAHATTQAPPPASRGLPAVRISCPCTPRPLWRPGGAPRQSWETAQRRRAPMVVAFVVPTAGVTVSGAGGPPGWGGSSGGAQLKRVCGGSTAGRPALPVHCTQPALPVGGAAPRSLTLGPKHSRSQAP